MKPAKILTGPEERTVLEASDLYDAGFPPGVWPHFFSYGGHRYGFVRFAKDREGEIVAAFYDNEDGETLEVLND